ncbi:MAG: hypothetical protein EOO15_15815 [Chitinophagaceae bacterium]|nr:MAG: hypothetical protein EOO15_15815 [Chitinophagaceae bacterium]
MRQILVFALLAGIGFGTRAQDTSARRDFEFRFVHRKWYCFKLNPAGVYFGKLSLFGEYTTGRQHFRGRPSSFIVGIGIPIESEHQYPINGKRRTLAMRSFSVMAGYRVYVTRAPGVFGGEVSGLYVEPYIKYLTNSVHGTFNANLASSATAASEVSYSSVSKYTGFGCGVQLGFQFHIRRKFLVDAFLVGGEMNSVKASIVLKDMTSQGAWNSFQSSDAQNVLDDYRKLPIIGRKLVTHRDDVNRNISGTYGGLLPGFRIGISIGYSFRRERPS